jgi:hypothetical protein
MPRLTVLCCTIGAVLGAGAVPAGAATANGGTGSSTLTLKGAVATSLARQGVTFSAVKPATAKGKAYAFPVRTVQVGASSTLVHAGGLKLSAGKRTLTLAAPKLKLGDDALLLAKLGKAYKTLLVVDATDLRVNTSGGAVGLKAGTVRLTVTGAAAIRKALHLKALAPGKLGTLAIDARRDAAPTSGAGGTGTTTGTAPGTDGGAGTGTGTGGSGTGTGGGTTTTPKGCTSTPPAGASGGPAALARPVSAVDATAAGITWHVRDSFIQYINTGEGTAVSGGATADPATVQPGSSSALVYAFHFPFKDGWYDPVSQTARLTYSGTVSFCYAAHGIQLSAANPEVEIAGGSSRAVFTTVNTGEAAKRGVLVNLDPSHAAAITHNGAQHTWSQVPGSIPADAGESVFAGFYAAGDPFGWITVAATT